ncbi:MAG: acyl-CoA dehydrogenase family protein [bacterium]
MVSFQLDDEQRMIRDTVADFAKNELRPAARKCDEEGTIPEELVRKAWDLGLVRNAIPESFGGFGAERSVFQGVLVAEELAWGDLSIALHVMAPALFALPVLEMGTGEQKSEHLPRFCADEFAAATMAVVEPSMSFDPASMTTRADPDGGDYVLNGRKCLVPLGSQAETFLVFAVTARGAGYAGVDGFIVPRKTTGLKKREREKNMGLKALDTIELELKECRVPRNNRLGGDGGCNFLKLMNYSRIALTAAAVGVARAAFEYSRDYAKERVAFGEPIASRQAIAFMLAEMAIEIDAARLLAWEAAWKMDRGEDVSRQAYLAKRYSADMVMKTTDRAVQILGGHGYIREHPVEMWLRNGRGFAAFEGLCMV